MSEKTNGKPINGELVNEQEASAASPERKLVLAREAYPARLPLIPLEDAPLFPKMTVPMVVDHEPLINLLTEAAASKVAFVGLVLKREAEDKGERPALYEVGVIGTIISMIRLAADSPVQVVLSTLDRFRVEAIIPNEHQLIARVQYLYETEFSRNEELKAYSLSVIRSINELVKLNPLHKEELNLLMTRSSIAEPGRLADIAASLTTATGPELQDILETISIPARLRKVLVLLKKEIEISRLQVKIGKQIEERLTKQQREFFLREQLKEIKKELGLEKEGKEAELEEFKQRIEKLTLPAEARERIDEEMNKLQLLEPVSPEFNVSRTYLDWLTLLPWGVFTEDRHDIKAAARILDQDHYGLEDVKTRILEFLSVGLRKGNISGSILCFVGPPGTGKTSIGRSIARSLDRHFYRFSIGGMRDEAEIKGHRRTYIGALPGKFIQAIKVCKSANPVIMLDEIDKIGASYQGDPASALLEVLDPEQNREFLDHYLDVRFDLSNVFFITTANTLDTIPRPLLDRMEVIKLAGYILQEKLEIAQRFLIPKQYEAHGLTRAELTITKPALRELIDGYAREPGVRGVENHLKKIIRKTVKRMVEGDTKKTRIDVADIKELLGNRMFTDDPLYKNPIPGVVMGLAWTNLGGDTLYIEATHIANNKPGFKQTGQLGDVMVESSEIAYTYVQAYLNKDENARDFFQKNFIHLHVPAGATPKDGPSAGLTMAMALYSLVKQRPVKKKLAMTGELSLSGLVMPIGGIKEKVLATRRAKVKSLVLPEGNRKDYEELPAHLRKGITPHFVSTFDEAAAICMGK